MRRQSENQSPYGRFIIRLIGPLLAAIWFPCQAQLTVQPIWCPVDSTMGNALPAFDTIRTLVVLVDFPDDKADYPEWPLQATTPPPLAYRFFSNGTIAGDPFSLTSYFREASLGRLTFLGDVHPQIIKLPFTLAELEEQGGADAANPLVFDRLKADSSISWSRYDRWTHVGNKSWRKQPDGVIDNIILLFRCPPRTINPAIRWIGDNGGVGSLFGRNYRINEHYLIETGSLKSGLNMFFENRAYLDIASLMKHELAHFFTLNHYAGHNDAFGPDFVVHGAWGLASAFGSSSACVNAWDRDHLGWARYHYEVGTQVDTAFTLTLTDFLTTGDACRIKLPYVDDEYFLLEFHNNQGLFDTVDHQDKGLFILHQSGGPPHHLHLEEADGKWDWSLSDSGKVNTYCCGMHDMIKRGDANPLAGFGDRDAIVLSKTRDTILRYNQRLSPPVLAIEGEPQILHYFGDGNDGFTPDKGRNVFAMYTNPSSASNGLRNRVLTTWLNGIRVEVLNQSSNSITLRIATHDFRLVTSQRWCGEIRLNDSLIMEKKTTLRLNQSGVFNKHNAVFPYAHMKVSGTGAIYLKRKSRIVIEEGCSLELDPNAKLYLQKGSKIKVKRGGQLIARPDQLIRVN